MEDIELFDDDMYPSEEALQKIRNWEVGNENDFHDLMNFCKRLWYSPDYFCQEDDAYHLITCGWSGNESIISAMKSNHMFWLLYWALSERGGYFIFCPYHKEYEIRT